MFEYFFKIKEEWKRFLRFATGQDDVQLELPMPAEELYCLQAEKSVLSKQFCFILVLSTVIATLGLMGDSPAIVIGAMLIAPMMKPIIALAYSLVIAHRKLAARDTLTLAIGIVLTVSVSAGVEHIVDLKGETQQILTRIHPSTIDLGVAIAAGTAAALANVRKNIADSLPGVAIAVALVPPLCVVGIGLSLQNWTIGIGALFLFSVNLLAIIFCACLVFLFEGYGSWWKARISLTAIVLLMAGMFVPLSGALEELSYDDRAQQAIEAYLSRNFPINKEVHPDDLNKVQVSTYPDHLYVYAEIKASTSSITPKEVMEIKQLMENEFNESINLKVQLTISQELLDYSVAPNNELLLYDDIFIPRR